MNLYVAPSPRKVFFATRDRKQQRVADALGFKRLARPSAITED